MVTWARRATTAVPASTRPASCTRVRCGARASARTGRRAGTAIADMGLLGAGIGRGPDYVVLGSDPEGSLAARAVDAGYVHEERRCDGPPAPAARTEGCDVRAR